VEPFNINLTSVGPKTCNRGDDWGTYKDVVNCNTCRVPGLRITKESVWGFFEGRTPEDRQGLPLERAQEVCVAVSLDQLALRRLLYKPSCLCHSLPLCWEVECATCVWQCNART
jgi:hypothetical protein